MATKKKSGPIPKPSGPQSWAEDHEKYPLKRGVCDFCHQKDDLK